MAVLSAATEAYDRGTKLIHYRKLASLAALLLIARDRPHAEHYVRRTMAAGVLADHGCRCALTASGRSRGAG